MSVITLEVNNTARGTVTGGGTYTDGQEITVTATNNSGYLFAYWSDGNDIVSSSANYTFEVSGDLTLTAYFLRDVESVRIYGLCEANCRHRVLSMGQVISLIQEMALNGWQVPEDYIPQTAVNEIVNQNTGEALKIFIGTQNAWTNWESDKTNVLFIPTDDITLRNLNETLQKLNEAITSLETRLVEGTLTVEKANYANDLTKTVVYEGDHSTVVNTTIDGLVLETGYRYVVQVGKSGVIYYSLIGIARDLGGEVYLSATHTEVKTDDTLSTSGIRLMYSNSITSVKGNVGLSSMYVYKVIKLEKVTI